MQIEGSVVLVTGGAKGLGLAIASHLQSLGAIVIAADLDAAALATLPKGIEPARVDITDPEAAAVLVGELWTRHSRIDVLINNAGMIYSEPMIDIMRPDQMMHDLGRFRRCLTANLDSVFIMTAAVVEQMARKRIRGVVVNISSISARGNAGQTAYAAAKARGERDDRHLVRRSSAALAYVATRWRRASSIRRRPALPCRRRTSSTLNPTRRCIDWVRRKMWPKPSRACSTMTSSTASFWTSMAGW